MHLQSSTLAILSSVLFCTFTRIYALRPSQYGPGAGGGPYSSSSSSNLRHPRANLNPPRGEYYTNNQEPYQGSSNNEIDPSWINENPLPMENESFEERLASWREQQQYKYEHQSTLDAANPRDEDGKMKLLASVSRGSIAIFFFILMWRSVHHYELADQTFRGATRFFMVLPPVVLFLGNMAGCVGSIMSSNGTSGKKRLKAILNLNKLVEIVLMMYNVMRLLLVPSKLVMREVYVGRTLSNFLFLVQCQLFTKVTWNAAKPSLQQNVGASVSMDNGDDDYDDGNDGRFYQERGRGPYGYNTDNNNNYYQQQQEDYDENVPPPYYDYGDDSSLPQQEQDQEEEW